MTRVLLSDAARADLLARYKTRAEAETQLAVYLKGIVDALGIPAESVEGFDDSTGELVLAEGTIVKRQR